MNVIKLADHGVEGLQDVPRRLRMLADTLEKDIAEYGPECVCRAAVVVRFSQREPMVFGFGAIESIAQTYMDLHAGAAELMAMTHPER